MKLLPKAKSDTFFSNSFFIFIIRFFPSLANLMVVIYYSHHLNQQLYGSYQNFWIELNILYPLACFGMQLFVVTYSPAFLTRLIRSIKAKGYFIYTLWLAIVSISFALIQTRLLHIPFALSLFFILFYAANIVAEAFLIVFKRFKSLTIINILFAGAYWLAHWHVLNTGFSIQRIYTWLLILYGIKMMLYLIMSAKDISKTASNNEASYSIEKIRSLWVHLGLYDILQNNSTWIDKFIISIFLNSQLSAVYYNGTINIPFLPLILSAALSAILMQLATTKKHNEVQQTIQLMNQTGRVLSCIVFPLFFFLAFFRSEVIVILFSAKYAAATPIFLVSILVLPLRAYSFTTVLQSQHKGAIINAGALAEILLACALMYPLYRLLGLPGVALSFVITTYLQAVFYLFYSARALGVRISQLVPLGNWLLKLIVFALLFIAIHYVATLFFTDRNILILGACALLLTVPVALLIEIKTTRGKYGNSAQA